MNARIIALLICFIICGCQRALHDTPGAGKVIKPPDARSVRAVRYVVDPPDEITILAPGIAELHERKQIVSPEGTVTFNLIGAVPVQGKTPDEIADLFKRLTSKYYSNADIKVIVTAQSKFFYIFGRGAGQNGLKHPYTGRDTIVGAMADAGFNESSWPEQVRLSRPAKNGHGNEMAVVDFMKIFDTGDMSQNYLLEEGDIIHVPDAPLPHFSGVLSDLTNPLTGAASASSAVRAGAVRPR